MNTAQDNIFIVEQLVRVTNREVHYLLRTAARLQSRNIDLSWVESLENNDERSEMLDALQQALQGVDVLTGTQHRMADYAQRWPLKIDPKR